MKKENSNEKPEPCAKPFLKWAGGKGQLLNQFRDFYPVELKSGKITRYYEPFIGGGAVFFEVAQQYNVQSAHLYDINQELIITWRVIQKDVFRLIETLDSIAKKYVKLDDESRAVFFYNQRNEFNRNQAKTNFSNYKEDWILR